MSVIVAERHRPLMFAIAYRMLGTVSEAEDVVQTAILRLQERPAEADNPEAYVTTVTTRLAIDELRSARRRRESYVGAWFPEPLVGDGATDPAASAERDEAVRIGMLTLLERLGPVERAVFVLREAFDYDYDDIARIVDRSVVACRQILRRARERVAEDRPRFVADPARQRELAARFLLAATTGDVAGLERLLADDVEMSGDGGGKVAALASPAVGRTRVARFVLGVVRQLFAQDLRVRVVTVNGEPGVLAFAADGQVVGVLAIETDGERIVALRNIINPDKLGHVRSS